jgi:hypothetical protein
MSNKVPHETRECPRSWRHALVFDAAGAESAPDMAGLCALGAALIGILKGQAGTPQFGLANRALLFRGFAKTQSSGFAFPSAVRGNSLP